MRRAHKLSLILALVTTAHAFAAPDSPACASFECFLQELRGDAQARGVTLPVFDAAIASLSPDPRVLALANSAPEYMRPAGAYIAPRISAEVIASGRRHAERLSDTLRRIEAKYGVEREIL